MLGTYVFVLTDRSAMATPCSHLPGAVAWGTWATFVVAYLEGTFGLAQGIASTYALAQGVGLLAGTQLGGRLGDRFGTRRTIVIAVLAYGAAIGLVPNAGMPLLPTLALTFAAAACFGVRAVGNAALLTEQATAARTTAFAFSSAMVAAGTAFGGAAGGAVVDGLGFGGLGVLCGLAAAASAMLVLAFVTGGARVTGDR